MLSEKINLELIVIRIKRKIIFGLKILFVGGLAQEFWRLTIVIE